MLNTNFKNFGLESAQSILSGSDGIVHILSADIENIRSRRVVNRYNSIITGKYPGMKAGRMMQWESRHERNAMLLLDTCPSVLAFNEQPCEINYILQGQKRRHFPDFLVKGCGWKEFWEVKMQKDAYSPEVSIRTALMHQHLPRYGYGYRIVLAEHLAFKTRLENAKKILRLGKASVSIVDQEKTRQLFQRQRYLPWGLIAHNTSDFHLLNHVCRLILDGLIALDFNQPISDSTLITWVDQSKTERSAEWLSHFFSAV